MLYNKYGWSSLVQRHNKYLYLFIYESLFGHSPPYITYVYQTGPQDQTRTTKCRMLQVPQVYSELGKSDFSVCAPNTWNYIHV